MKYTLPLLLVCLTACQNNPYTASSVPLPPAPEGINNHLDLSAYPATPRDYSAYRNWSWKRLPSGTHWTSSEELQDIVRETLEQRGLRPATGESAADLKIEADSRLELRTYQSHDAYPDPYRGGYRPINNVYQVEMLVVSIRMFDAKSGQVVWSNSAETPNDGSRSAHSQALRNSVKRALDNFPPA